MVWSVRPCSSAYLWVFGHAASCGSTKYAIHHARTWPEHCWLQRHTDPHPRLCSQPPPPCALAASPGPKQAGYEDPNMFIARSGCSWVTIGNTQLFARHVKEWRSYAGTIDTVALQLAILSDVQAKITACSIQASGPYISLLYHARSKIPIACVSCALHTSQAALVAKM